MTDAICFSLAVEVVGLEVAAGTEVEVDGGGWLAAGGGCGGLEQAHKAVKTTNTAAAEAILSEPIRYI